MIEMGLTRPALIRASTPGDPASEPSHSPSESESESASASERAPAREGRVLTLPAPREAEATALEQADDGRAEMVPAPVPASGTAARVWATSKRRAGQTYQAGRVALGGSVWRTRPAALRDVAARVQRAEWAPNSSHLLLAGQAYGYVALFVVAVLYTTAKVVEWVATVLIAGLYAAAEVEKRPLRLAVAVLIVLVPLLVAVL